MGSLYLRGNTWWIKYYRQGKCFRESSESTKKMVAKKLLARKEGDIAKGKIPGVRFDKVIFEDLADNFLKDCVLSASLRKLFFGPSGIDNWIRRWGVDSYTAMATAFL